MIQTLQFNGKDNYIILGDVDKAKSLITGSFTVEAWVKESKKHEWQCFVGVVEDTRQQEKGWMLGVTFDRQYTFAAALPDSDDLTKSSLVYLKSDQKASADTWHHLAGVFTNAKMELYIDGVLVSSKQLSGSQIVYPETGDFVIGTFKDSDEFYPLSGRLTDIRLWNIARTAQQIADNKDLRLNPAENENLVGCWPLNDGAGSMAENWADTENPETIEGSTHQWVQDYSLTLGGYSPAPNAPILETLGESDISESGFTAKWSEVLDATSYFIDVAKDEDFTEFVDGYENKTVTDNQIVVSGLDYETQYFWRVRSQNSKGTSKNSDTGTVTTKSVSVPEGNYAAVITANGDFIQVGKVDEIKDLIVKDFTVEIWVRPDMFQYLEGYIGVVENTSETEKGWLLGVKNQMFSFEVSGKNTTGAGETGKITRITVSNVYPESSWRHVAGTYDGENMKLYIDGELEASSTGALGDIFYPEITDSGDTETGNIVIGALRNSSVLKSCRGMLSECRIWDTALSQEDIKSRMYYRASSESSDLTNLICRWPMDEGQGTTVHDAVRGLNGLMQGNATWTDALDLVLFRDLNLVASVAAGLNHTVALRKDGSVWAWGSNTTGQLGDGTRTLRVSPILVKGSDDKYLKNIKQVAAGSFHSIALAEDGTVYAWGNNFFYQAGQDDPEADYLTAVQVSGLSDVQSISTLLDTNLALKSDGTVWAWGRNDWGQLGDGTMNNSYVPVQVVSSSSTSGYLEDITAVTSGKFHSAALTSEGKVMVWGGNSYHQLCDGTDESSLIPKAVQNSEGEDLTGVLAIAAGMYHTIALLESNGSIWGWGSNLSGQLGNQSTDGSYLERAKGSTGQYISGALKISCGYHHSMAIAGDGKMMVWGRNESGQLDGTAGEDTNVPVFAKDKDDSDLFPLYFTGGSAHTMVVEQDENIYGWGENESGQLGDGTQDKDILYIAAGVYHKLAVKKDGTVWAWGYNPYGQLGDGSTVNRSTPVQVLGVGGVGTLSNIKAVAAGYSHSLALDTSGQVYAWGYNGNGELGNNSTTNSSTPVKVSGINSTGYLSNIKAVACGSGHSFAVDTSGQAYAWGYNNYGQLGDNSTTTRTCPIKVKSSDGSALLSNIDSISCRGHISLALGEDRTVWAWGYNCYGQLGNGTTTNSSLPVQVKGVNGSGTLSDIIKIASGFYHCIALSILGSVYTWGYNDCGQLGNNSTAQSTTPVKVLGAEGSGYLTDIADIASGFVDSSYGASLALGTDGTVWSWGSNYYGQLGNGTGTNSPIPIKVLHQDYYRTLLGIVSIQPQMALQDNGRIWVWGDIRYGQAAVESALLTDTFTDIGSGSYHSLGLKPDGTVWAWGYNNYGQIGDGTTVDKDIPVKVDTISGIKSLASGVEAWHSMAVGNDGSLYAWGYNCYGQLGDGSTTNCSTPVQVKGVNGSGYLQNITAAASPYLHSLAVDSNGYVYAWGYNPYGQLGNSTTANSYYPVRSGSLTGITSVAGGELHSLALSSSGQLYAWGYNSYGQIGTGSSTSNYYSPVSSISGVKAIDAGWYHTLALKQDGTVWACGYNCYGQLGINTADSSSHYSFVQVKNEDGSGYLNNIVAIAAGAYFSLAADYDGNLFVWGYYYNRDTYTTTSLPLKLDVTEDYDLAPAGITALAAGYDNYKLLREDGQILTMGYNTYGVGGYCKLLPVKVAKF